jgi:hypothetical protein
MWLCGLRILAKPVPHLHTQFNRDLSWDSIDMDFMNLNQSAHGDREFGYMAAREAFRAVAVFPYPIAKPIFQLLLLFSRGDGLRLIYSAASIFMLVVSCRSGVELHLAPTQFELMAFLFEHQGPPVRMRNCCALSGGPNMETKWSTFAPMYAAYGRRSKMNRPGRSTC